MECGYRSMCTNRKLRKWAIEYEDPIAEVFPLVWKSCCWGFQDAKYGFEPVVGSKYGLAAKYNCDGLAVVIFWKFIDVLDDFHIKLYGDSFWEKSYSL